MEAKPNFKYYQDEKDDKLSQKIFIKFIVIFFVVYLVVMGFGFIFYQNFSYITISGISMQSTLNPSPVDELQDGVYIKHTHDVDYGDIVVLDTSLEGAREKTTIIKRVIGLEGDYVTIVRIDGQYHVLRVQSNTNSVEVLEEDYIYSYSEWSGKDARYDIEINGVFYESGIYENFKNYGYECKTFKVNELDDAEVEFFKVTENSIFFLGDNRGHSNDSRGLGFFKLDKIEGKVVDIVKDGSSYEGNNFWWFNRLKGFFRVIWQEILRFFGSNA